MATREKRPRRAVEEQGKKNTPSKTEDVLLGSGSDIAIVEKSFLCDEGTTEALALTRELAKCLNTIKNERIDLKSVLYNSARMLMLDHILTELLKREYYVCVNGYHIPGEETECLFDRKDSVVMAMASIRNKGSQGHTADTWVLSFYLENELKEEHRAGNIEVDFSGALLNSFPACADLFLDVVNEAEEITHVFTEFDTALFRDKQ